MWFVAFAFTVGTVVQFGDVLPLYEVSGKVTLNKKAIEWGEDGELVVVFEPLSEKFFNLDKTDEGKLIRTKTLFLASNRTDRQTYRIAVPRGKFQVGVYIIDLEFNPDANWPSGDRLRRAFRSDRSGLSVEVNRPRQEFNIDIDQSKLKMKR